MGEGLGAPRHVEDTAALEEALERDRQLLRDRLKDVYRLPEVREASFLASPGLDERFAIWAECPDGEKGRSVEKALVK